MRRLNVKLLLWLVGGSVAFVLGVWGLWYFQINRTAGTLLVRADQLAKEKKYTEALKEYDRYFRFRKNDSKNYTRYALLHDEYSRLPDATPEDRMRAISFMTFSLSMDPAQPELKRKLVDHLLNWRRDYVQAKPLLEELVASNKDDAELEAMLAQCYVLNNELDRGKELYQKAIEHNPKRVETYAALAGVLQSRLNQPAEALKLLDLAVERNPDNAQAYIERARFKHTDDPAAAREDIDKALSLAPKDVWALKLGADAAIREGDTELARRRLEIAREAHPDDPSVLIMSANIEARADIKKAQAILEDGIRRMPRQWVLQMELCELQLANADLPGAKKTLEALRKQPTLPPPYRKMFEGRIHLEEKNYEMASRLFEEVRTPLARTKYGPQVNVWLSQCYQSSGRLDRQLIAAQQAYEQDPTNSTAKITYAAALEANRQRAEALKIYETMLDSPTIQVKVAQMKVSMMAEKPTAEQNWDEVDTFIAEIRGKGAPTLLCDILQSQVYRHKDEGQKAIEILAKARDQFPDQVQAWLALYEITRDVEGLESASKVMAQIVQKFGKTEQIGAIMLRDQLRVETSADQIAKIEAELPNMKETEKVRALALLSDHAARAGDSAKAKSYLLQLEQMKPKDGGILLALFTLARETKNSADMKEVVERIRNDRGEKSFEYLYSSSAMTIHELLAESLRTGQYPGPERKDELAKIRQQIQAAQQLRSNFPDLMRIDGDLALLEGDSQRAIEAFRKASDGAGTSPDMIQRVVQLLYRQGRSAEALAEINKLDDETIKRMNLDLIRVDLLLRANQIDEALPLVPGVVADSKDWQRHAWAANIYSRADRLTEAEAELRAAVEYAGPTDIEPYIALVGFLAKKTANIPEAYKVIEQAKQRVKPEEQPLLLGECYEKVNDVELARRSFEQAIAARPKDLRALGGAIGFYLRQKQEGDAIAMLDKMIGAALESDKSEERSNAAWARRVKAQILAKGGRYQNTLEAIALIDENEKDGLASADDLSLKASLLADRPDRPSRLKAKEIFERLIPQRPDPTAERFALAKIYDREGDWPKARAEFLEVLGQRSDDPRMVYDFCRMLLRHGDVLEAPRWLARLEEIAPGGAPAIEIRGRLLAAQGKKKEAAEVLNSMIARPVTEANVGDLLVLADIFDSLNMVSDEEKIYREFYQVRPNEHLVLAAFLARHGAMSEVMDLCRKAAETRETAAVTQVAVGAVQNQPGSAGEDDYKTIEGWLQEGIQKDPKSAVLQLHLADFRYGQGRYDEAEKIYRDFLARSDVSIAARANALNNLSFVMSLRDKQNPAKLDEAAKMIDEAILAVGPVSELVDTRGMVALARGKTDDAVKDLLEAVADRPSGVKYFHLALAQQAAGDLKSADESFRHARELGFTKEHVTPLELASFAALEKALINQ